MDTVRIQTTQNVRIEYQLAGIGERFVASIIDEAIRWGYFFILLLIFRNIVDFNDEFPFYIFIILQLPALFYSLIFETIYNGQTPGKKVMGTKVIQLDGSQPTFTSYFLRWLLYFVDVYFFTIGVLFIVFTKKSQRWGDMAAGTVVIKLHRNTYISNTVFAKIEDGYEPKYPQVVLLTDHDVRTIRDVYNQGMADYNRQAIIALFEKVKNVLGVTTEDKPSVFIVTVIKDYNYYLTLRHVQNGGDKEEVDLV